MGRFELAEDALDQAYRLRLLHKLPELRLSYLRLGSLRLAQGRLPEGSCLLTGQLLRTLPPEQVFRTALSFTNAD